MTAVIVPTIHAQPALLATCLESVERTLGPDDELVVVDGGTFAENCNAGAAATTQPVLVFLNDDTDPHQADWLERLIGPLAHPKIGIVGARLVYPNGHLQHTGVTLERIPGGLDMRNRKWDAPSGLVDAVTAACMAIRADVFGELNGFDPMFRNGAEDVDLCLRARQAGYRSWYENTVTVIHHESASGPLRWRWTADNIRLFQDRWSTTWLMPSTS